LRYRRLAASQAAHNEGKQTPGEVAPRRTKHISER
jgi:hypothetical protein